MVPAPPLSDAIEAKIFGDDCKVDVMGNAFEFHGTSSYNGDACVAPELADTFSLTHGGKSTVPLRYATIDEVRVALEAELFEAVAVSMTDEVAWDDGADVTFLSVAPSPLPSSLPLPLPSHVQEHGGTALPLEGSGWADEQE